MTERPAPLWYVLVAVAVSMLLVSLAGVWYTRHVQAEADRRWCATITILAEGPPATSDRGRAVAEAMAELRRELGCP